MITPSYGIVDPVSNHYILVTIYTPVPYSLEVLHGILHPKAYGNQFEKKNTSDRFGPNLLSSL